MTDRELLELAAKAAGITGTLLPFYDIDGEIEGYDFVVKGCPWNPLTDDGDALRLAVKMAMEIDTGYSDKFVQARTPGGEWFEAVIASSAESATRRAIVRAAAEIGKGMK